MATEHHQDEGNQGEDKAYRGKFAPVSSSESDNDINSESDLGQLDISESLTSSSPSPSYSSSNELSMHF